MGQWTVGELQVSTSTAKEHLLKACGSELQFLDATGTVADVCVLVGHEIGQVCPVLERFSSSKRG